MKQKLRVGLLLDDMRVPAWAHCMIARICQSNYASIELLVLNDIIRTKKSVINKIKDNWDTAIPTVIEKVLECAQHKLIDKNECLPDAFEMKDLENLLTEVPILKVKPVQKKWSDYLAPEDITSIEKHNIDVFIRLGFRILRGKILHCARFGIWSYHHGDNHVNRGGPAGFWEVMESWPETGSILQILTEDLDNGTVLYRSYSKTYELSVKYSRNIYYWKTLSFIPRQLEELYKNGWQHFSKKIEQKNMHPVLYSNRIYVKPDYKEYAKVLTKKLFQKYCQYITDKIYDNQWIIMFDLRDNFSGALWRFKPIIPPKDRFWADPHVIHKEDRYYVFIEEYLYKEQKGHISLIVMDEQGNYQDPIKILERPYHLSYPFVFENNNELYMIPETGSNKTIELYKCVEFPCRWEFVMNLMDNVQAFDTTLLHLDDTWWLFTNIIENEGASSCDELFLYYSKDLFSTKWIPHPLNPIVSDVKSARPAGKIFIHRDKLYRPSQDCSVRYGYGINLNVITKLNESEYDERCITAAKPKWRNDLLGTHTFNCEHKLTVIDGLIQYRKWL